MAEFLISKKDGASPTGWVPVTVVEANTTDDLREVVKQGYQGGSRYCISRWDNRREFDLRPGAVEATEQPPA